MKNHWSPPQAEKVQQIFSSVSKGYDLANRILSLGLDQLWRRQLVRQAIPHLPLEQPAAILDVATGTGDLAMAFRKELGAGARIIGADFSPAMLDVARSKDASIQWQTADALQLPFADSSFDLATISFGLRNVTDTAQAVRELHRVVRPGGIVLILEFGNPGRSMVGRFINLINRIWLRTIGGAITGSGWAYQYLSETSEAFPGANALAVQVKGWIPGAKVTTRTLFPGICYLCQITSSRAGRYP